MTDRKTFVSALCAQCRPVLAFIPNRDDRPLKAIEAAEAWTRGEATIAEVIGAAGAAAAAYNLYFARHASAASSDVQAALAAAAAAYAVQYDTDGAAVRAVANAVAYSDPAYVAAYDHCAAQSDYDVALRASLVTQAAFAAARNDALQSFAVTAA